MKDIEIIILKDSGIQELGRNGGRIQEILFKINNNKFQIIIKDESYISQSYAKLFKWDDKHGWFFITSENPHDNGQSIAYVENYDKDNYKDFIISLKKIAMEFI